MYIYIYIDIYVSLCKHITYPIQVISQQHEIIAYKQSNRQVDYWIVICYFGGLLDRSCLAWLIVGQQ